MNAFKYNPNKKYNPNIRYSKKDINIFQQAIFVNQKDSFNTTFSNLFQKYQNPTIHTNGPYNAWYHSSFDWWQCQLNFAVWCASTGCGVSYNDHIKDSNDLTKSVYIFHLYYCIARILKEIKSPLPTDPAFCYYKNQYDLAAYQKLCAEFHISPHTDWRQRVESTHNCAGLGLWSQYYKPSDSYRMSHSGDGLFQNIRDSITHQVNISMAWTTFILDKSEGFTYSGIERINESIRTYVWALVGAQSQTRVDVLKIGTGFDAQKQFLSNVQDVINSPVDLPTQILNYQNVLKYARSKVDYAYGFGLYMSPSDMVLRISTVEGYNNEIVIASKNQTLGFNSDVNIKPVALIPSEPINGTPTKISLPEPKPEHPSKVKESEPPSKVNEHENTKIAIIVGSIVIAIVSLFIYEKS